MSGNVRIKICGVRSVADALAAVEAGADLIGLNFVPGSPRCLDLRTAEAISEALAEQPVERVALFKDAEWNEIDTVLRRVDFDRIQFHGEETEDDIESIDLPAIKAIRGADQEAADVYPGAILLLDHPHEGGGQGKAWDWSEAEDLIAHGCDVIVAGGLTPDNVEQALDDVGDVPPWGVDVATGVEGANGEKDPALMKAFVEAVRRHGEGDEVVEYSP